MLGPDTSSHVTQVACHPSLPVVAIGYADGALALARIGKPAREVALRAGDGTAITAMAFSPDGGRLAVGGRGGVALVYEWAEAQ